MSPSLSYHFFLRYTSFKASEYYDSVTGLADTIYIYFLAFVSSGFIGFPFESSLNGYRLYFHCFSKSAFHLASNSN